MEENKKVVDMKSEPKTQSKVSYEELENIAAQLSAQNRQLYARVQQMDITNLLRRLDYMFKVVENSHVFSEEFVTKCVNEIEEMLTAPEGEQEVNKESEQSSKDVVN